MKLLVVTPITTPGLHVADEFSAMVDSDTEIVHTTLEVGPASTRASSAG